MSTIDVTVVGAGPAGIAAALTAARAGLDVLVIDRATFPRDKTCGDGLTALALGELEHLGIDPRRAASWQPVERVRLRSPRGRQLTLPMPADGGHHSAVVSRMELDHHLVVSAGEAGVDVRQGLGFVGLTQREREGHVSLELSDGSTMSTRWLIAADGMWSAVRKATGTAQSGYRGDWHAARQYFTSTGEGSRDQWVWFEPDLLPGYAWSFPLPGGVVNVGYGIVRGDALSGKDFARTWAELLERPHIRAVLGELTPQSPYRAWPIPARIGDLDLTAGRVLFVGDAAAATDPMTGEGIGQALETGRLAATAIAGGGPTGVVASRYRTLIARNLRADDRMARVLSSLLARRWAAESALRLVDTSDWTRRHFARWMFEDYPRALICTPRRWRRGMFTPTGSLAGS